MCTLSSGNTFSKPWWGSPWQPARGPADLSHSVLYCSLHLFVGCFIAITLANTAVCTGFVRAECGISPFRWPSLAQGHLHAKSLKTIKTKFKKRAGLRVWLNTEGLKVNLRCSLPSTLLPCASPAALSSLTLRRVFSPCSF